MLQKELQKLFSQSDRIGGKQHHFVTPVHILFHLFKQIYLLLQRDFESIVKALLRLGLA